MDSFAQRFDLALDYQRYLASKGIYVENGNHCIWEPLDWTDTEPLDILPAPGAMNRNEVDSFDPSDIEEF